MIRLITGATVVDAVLNSLAKCLPKIAGALVVTLVSLFQTRSN